MGRVLMFNGATMCDGRTDLEILVRYSSEIWKSLESDPTIVFANPLIIWYCKDTLLLMRFKTNHCETVSWGYWVK